MSKYIKVDYIDINCEICSLKDKPHRKNHNAIYLGIVLFLKVAYEKKN